MPKIWKRYPVVLEFSAPFGASTPKNPKDIEAMLAHRMPAREPENATPIEELAAEVAGEVGASEESERGWSTFKRDNQGIYYEPRCVRAHLKDCALQVAKVLDVRALKSKVANQVYVKSEKLRLTRPSGETITAVDGTVAETVTDVGTRLIPITDVDGWEIRMIHIITKKGPRNDFKFVDYVAPPSRLAFTLLVLRGADVDDRGILEAIFEYGGIHGMGAERSQQWGQYNVVDFAEE